MRKPRPAQCANAEKGTARSSGRSLALISRLSNAARAVYSGRPFQSRRSAMTKSGNPPISGDEGGDALDAEQQRTVAQVAGASGTLALGNICSRILGFARETALTYLFGASGAVDAFQVAIIVPKAIYDLLIGGHINGAIVPVLSEIIARRGAEELWRVVSILLSLATVALTLLALLIELFAAQIVELVAGGADAGTARLAGGHAADDRPCLDLHELIRRLQRHAGGLAPLLAASLRRRRLQRLHGGDRAKPGAATSIAARPGCLGHHAAHSCFRARPMASGWWLWVGWPGPSPSSFCSCPACACGSCARKSTGGIPPCAASPCFMRRSCSR